MQECEEILQPYQAQLLPEIHERYSMQQKIAQKDYYVYDFASPMLLIHGLYYGETKYLKNRLEILIKTKEDIFRFGANVLHKGRN